MSSEQGESSDEMKSEGGTGDSSNCSRRGMLNVPLDQDFIDPDNLNFLDSVIVVGVSIPPSHFFGFSGSKKKIFLLIM